MVPWVPVSVSCVLLLKNIGCVHLKIQWEVRPHENRKGEKNARKAAASPGRGHNKIKILHCKYRNGSE